GWPARRQAGRSRSWEGALETSRVTPCAPASEAHSQSGALVPIEASTAPINAISNTAATTMARRVRARSIFVLMEQLVGGTKASALSPGAAERAWGRASASSARPPRSFLLDQVAMPDPHAKAVSRRGEQY